MTPAADECPDCTVRMCAACERAEWAAENDAETETPAAEAQS